MAYKSYYTLKQWLTGRKEGKMEKQKFEYLDNKNGFLDQTKKHFS